MQDRCLDLAALVLVLGMYVSRSMCLVRLHYPRHGPERLPFHGRSPVAKHNVEDTATLYLASWY